MSFKKSVRACSVVSRRCLIALVQITSMFSMAAARAELPDAIARVKPSVVVVGTFRSTDSPRFRMRGTGFVVGEGSQVLTNAHVLPDDSENTTDARLVVQVRTSNGDLQMRGTTLQERDLQHDLALLRIDGPPVAALALKNSDTVREGQSVAFIGFPIGGALGFSPVTHRAVVSSITSAALPAPSSQQLGVKAIRGLRDGTFKIFQLDGTAYPGNSGGPLFDVDTGEVVGVVNMVFVKGTRESALTNPSGISYAIPARFVAELLQRNH
jgi:serine protease Do